MSKNAPLVACPHCGELAVFAPENAWRPFCSERCKLIDLGAWANESYRIPVAENDAGEVAGFDDEVAGE